MASLSEIRGAARLAVVQALYQMELSEQDANDVIEQFVTHRLTKESDFLPHQDTDVDHFQAIARGVVGHQRDIDRTIKEALSETWKLSRLDSTVRALLRSATYELLFVNDVPARVVINEYIDVAHAFFDEDEPAFVNGVLDRIARTKRASEFIVSGEGDDIPA